MNFPIYIKPDVPYAEAPNASVFLSSGEQIIPSEHGIEISFRPNGGGLITFDSGESITFSLRFWNEVQSSPGYFIKIGKDDSRSYEQGGGIWIGKRKFALAVPADEESDSIPIEQIEIESVKLEDITFDSRLFNPIKTGTYIDKFFSRYDGLMPATNIMVTGDPGIGKSSNLMDILVNIHKTDINKRVLYISAEMSRVDVQEFLQFYPGLEKIDFLFLGDYVTDPNQKIKAYQALEVMLDKGWDVVVLDSLYEIQGMTQEDLGFSSFKRGEKYMLDLMNKHNKGHNKLNLYTTFLAIQQKNKSGQYVGSKRLEHMTTGFLQLLWDAKEKGKRYMIFEKNRKGKEKVKLYYNFDKEKGIVYDSIRHQKELEFMEILQQNSDLGLDQLDDLEFAKIFAEKTPDEAHAN